MTASVVDIRAFEDEPSKLGRWHLEESGLFLTHNSASDGRRRFWIRGQKKYRRNQFISIAGDEVDRAPHTDWYDNGESEHNSKNPGEVKGAMDELDNETRGNFLYIGTSNRHYEDPVFHIRKKKRSNCGGSCDVWGAAPSDTGWPEQSEYANWSRLGHGGAHAGDSFGTEGEWYFVGEHKEAYVWFDRDGRFRYSAPYTAMGHEGKIRSAHGYFWRPTVVSASIYAPTLIGDVKGFDAGMIEGGTLDCVNIGDCGGKPSNILIFGYISIHYIGIRKVYNIKSKII